MIIGEGNLAYCELSDEWVLCAGVDKLGYGTSGGRGGLTFQGRRRGGRDEGEGESGEWRVERKVGEIEKRRGLRLTSRRARK